MEEIREITAWFPVTDPSLDAPDGAVLRFPNGNTYERQGNEWCLLSECSGISATWCDIHGDCTCEDLGNGERTLDDNGCPLHDGRSEHGEHTDE